ncbi:hypothetical protein Xbed_03782 [Xenorhabdus beddingii]|uniref:Uncharacterized protein n=1 Tax=Xenorhabdus beddingii TaxID=40578 RepID=A0A1Y2S744_9GAMM|nr:hypothetical protein [Xenorhabdus beddingii]OTA13963.1 hypothetical protein Xbed_03782 [Xenorhabdus beddingii]
MTLHNVLKTVYIDNNDGNFLKYEIIGEHDQDIHFAMVFTEVRLIKDGISYSLWSEVDNIKFDHLEPPKNTSFQREVKRDLYPGKHICSVINECKSHRSKWQMA